MRKTQIKLRLHSSPVSTRRPHLGLTQTLTRGVSGRLADIPPEASGLGAQRAQTQKEKRTRAAEKKRARNVGQLKSMLGMPVDVLFEVSGGDIPKHGDGELSIFAS
jgi:hypothetical protein